MFFTHYNSKIGKIHLLSDGNSLKSLIIRKRTELINSAQRNDNLNIFTKTKKWLDDYFDGKNPKIDEIKLDPYGTKFQKIVWKILCNISKGKISTYKEIAEIVAKKMCKLNMSAQAIGGAVGSNPIPIIIPCHRVVGKNYNLIGYSEGLDIKITLLTLENVDLSKYLKDKIF